MAGQTTGGRVWMLVSGDSNDPMTTALSRHAETGNMKGSVCWKWVSEPLLGSCVTAHG